MMTTISSTGVCLRVSCRHLCLSGGQEVEGRTEELLFNGYKISVLENERCLGDGGDVCSIMGVCLMPLKCTHISLNGRKELYIFLGRLRQNKAQRQNFKILLFELLLFNLFDSSIILQKYLYQFRSFLYINFS